MVYKDWGTPQARAIRLASLQAPEHYSFASGSMGPKVEAACDFVRKAGGMAAIGTLENAAAILSGTAGTQITASASAIEWYEGNAKVL